MDTERYLKLAALAAVLIIALVYPVIAALVLTGVAAWHLEDFKIGEMALVEKVVRLTPPGVKAMVMSRTASSSDVPVKLALPAPDPVRDAVAMVDTKVREPVMNHRSGWLWRASEHN
jgi:hypothetical protein